MTTATKPGNEVFVTTHWSLVLSASRETSSNFTEALENLCRAYWYPLYAFVRRFGYSAHDAQDLTQEFFHRLCEKHWLQAADREKGKLRTFLIVALKNFMAKEWRHASAQRRGGGQSFLPLDTDIAETRYASDSSAGFSADRLYDREWAITLIEKTTFRLEHEYESSGKREQFESLKRFLMTERGNIDYGEVANDLHLHEGAARVAVHRIRKRFRELFRAIISETLEENSNVDEELRYLAKALSAE